MAAPPSPPAPTSPTSPSAPRRGSRRVSFGGKSDKTHRSSLSGNKISLTETHEEKAKRNLTTKADPTVAMYELQPMAVALEKSNLASLRSMQHKDQYGNIITDPDLSNPTRPRFERPLETIRSFEAAIYGTYNNSRPVSYIRDDSSQAGGYSRRDRDSYYGGHNGPSNGYRGYNDQSYYNGRGNQSRPDSYVESYMGPNDNYYPYNQNKGRGPRYPAPRMNSEQAYGNGNSSQIPYYAQNGYQVSCENTTASGSNTDSWGNNSTDPSSGSSMDQVHYQQQQQQQQQQAIAEKYGLEFGSGPNFNENNSFQSQFPAQGSRNGYSYYDNTPSTNNGKIPAVTAMADPNVGGPVGGAPAAPTKGHLRKATNATNASQGSQKRKSWFRRKFSKG